MENRHGILKRYFGMSQKSRINLMLNNYTAFTELIEIDRKRTEKLLNAAMVKSGRALSDFDNRDLGEKIFDALDNIENIRRDVINLNIIGIDFEVLQNQMRLIKLMSNDILERIYVDRIDRESIAVELGIPDKTVKSREARAKAQLRAGMLNFWNSIPSYRVSGY